MGRRLIETAGVAALIALFAGGAAAQAQIGYCQGDGGPAGAATEAEHEVVVGDPPLPRGVRTFVIEVGGVKTRVQQAGPPDARDAVVFLHGHPGSSRDWDDLVAATGRFARTIAFDFPGYGKSDKSSRDIHTVDGAAAFVGSVLDELGVERAALGVHDFGAVWGLVWASAHPDRFLGGVLVNSGVYIDWIPHPQAWVWASGAGEAWMAATTRTSFKESIRAQSPTRLPEAFLDRMYDDFDRGTRCAALGYYRSGFENPNRGRELADALRPHDRPALVVWGEDDPYVPAEHAERQREAFPHARVELIPGSGHWPFVDNPGRVRELVTDFLRPAVAVARPHLEPGRRRVVLHVESKGVLPALRVRATLRAYRGAARRSRTAGTTRTPVAVHGPRRLIVRLSRPLRPGRYRLAVRARGLPATRFDLRLRGRRSRSRAGAAPVREKR